MKEKEKTKDRKTFPPLLLLKIKQVTLQKESILCAKLPI